MVQIAFWRFMFWKFASWLLELGDEACAITTVEATAKAPKTQKIILNHFSVLNQLGLRTCLLLQQIQERIQQGSAM